jgi:hypothetical protein
MTVVHALAILEAATLECKKRDINTPEVREALDFLEPYIQPPSLIPHYRHELGAPVTASIIERANNRCFARLLTASEIQSAIY